MYVCTLLSLSTCTLSTSPFQLVLSLSTCTLPFNLYSPFQLVLSSPFQLVLTIPSLPVQSHFVNCLYQTECQKSFALSYCFFLFFLSLFFLFPFSLTVSHPAEYDNNLFIFLLYEINVVNKKQIHLKAAKIKGSKRKCSFCSLSLSFSLFLFLPLSLSLSLLFLCIFSSKSSWRKRSRCSDNELFFFFSLKATFSYQPFVRVIIERPNLSIPLFHSGANKLNGC